MPEKIFYQVFNGNLKITKEVIHQLKDEIKDLIQLIKSHNDIDNIVVLRNKLHFLVKEHSKKKKYKKLKKDLEHIEDLIEDIDTYIENYNKQHIKTIDVVKKVEKRYRSCDKIKPEKRDKYKPACIKKSKISYEKQLIELQVELLKMQKYFKEEGEKLIIIFEGRDAAGKGGTIKRFREYLNPRGAHVVALEKPTDEEKTQWYFQRYVKNFPSGGEIKFFDRSWYNRAGVEPVMGFCSKKQYEMFLENVPTFEKLIIDSGIKLIKFYFSASKDEQAKRFAERRQNPLKQYKLSPVDQYSQELWGKYSVAEYNNFKKTHTDYAPWIIIDSNDKKMARLNAIKYVLKQFDYPDKIDEDKLEIDPELVYSGEKKAKILAQEINTKMDLFNS